MFLRQSQRASAQSNRIISIGINLFLILVFLFVAGCVPQVAEPLSPTNTPESAQPASPTDTPITPSPSPTPAASVSYTFFPEIDASVKKAEPDTNLGDKSSLRVDTGSDTDESFIRFTIPEIPGRVQRVLLHLYETGSGSKDGPAVYTANGPWSEGEITWNNRPIHTEDILDNKLSVDADAWTEFDVTSAVTGSGTYNFVLSADSGDAAAFSSREGDWPPQLEVTFVPNVTSVPATATSTDDVTLVGAGDISMCDNDHDEATAQLLDTIPGVVFTTGDNVYSDGTAEQFKDCYDHTWGRAKDRIKPVPGNHDYHTEGASAYYQYFNNVPEYYANDLGSWRVYALNSDIDVSEDSPQVKWLKLDLATHPNQCVLAYWHVPRWSSGSTHGSSKHMQVLWKVLYNAGAELVINGHEHNYERFMPMNTEGSSEPQGLREIVVGTGGGSPYPFGDPLPTSEVRNSPIYGVLKLTLHSDSYDWQFVPVAGSKFTDSGSTECH